MTATQQLPFVYGKGAAKKSLLGRAITGDGAAIAASRDTYAMLIRKGVKTPIDGTANAALLSEYGAHFREYYDGLSVDRHVTTLMTGGRPAYLDIESDGLFMTHENPPSSWPSHHAAVAAASTARRYSLLTDMYGMTGDALYRAFSNHARAITNEFCDGDLEIEYDYTGPAQTIAYSYSSMTIESRDYSLTGSMANGVYGADNGTYFQSFGPVGANGLARRAKPGYVLVIARWHLSGVGQTGNEAGATWRMVVFRRKTKVPTRTAIVTIHPSIAQFNTGTTSQINLIMNTFVTSWIVRNSGVSQQLGLTARGDGAHRISSKLSFSYGVVTTGQEDAAPSTDASFGSFNDTWVQGSQAWYFPSTVTFGPGASSGQGTATSIPANTVPFGETAFAPRTVPEGFAAWSGLTVTNLAVRIAQFGRTAVQLGCDLTSHPVVGYRVRLESLPVPELITPEMVPQLVVGELCTKMSAADLRAILMAVESHSGESTASMRASLTADDREYYGIVVDDIVAPPDRNLSLTSVFQMASEAGESILDRFIIEKDPDDSESEAVTFRQADARSKKFREGCLTNKRRGYVIVGPTVAEAAPTTALYCAKIGGVMRLVKSDYTTLLTPEELDEAYLVIRSGRGIRFATAFKATAEYYSYQSPYGDNGYPQMYDAVCDQEFGASYGSITSAQGAQKGSSGSVWSSLGQLRNGYLKDPSEWTPEFWLINCASRAWKVETVLGTLLTNPYGVGSLTQKIIKAASSEM